MIGLDTGFFVQLLSGNKICEQVWKDLMESKYEAYISSLTFFELSRLSLKGALDVKAVQILFEALEVLCKVIWIDNRKLMEEISRLSYGTGIPAVDSIILGSFLSKNIKKVYTTDSHFLNYKNKKVKIVKI